MTRRFSRIKERYRDIYLEHAAFNHDLHPIDRDPSNLENRFLEDGWREIGVELNIVDLSSVFYLYREGSHCGIGV